MREKNVRTLVWDTLWVSHALSVFLFLQSGCFRSEALSEVPSEWVAGAPCSDWAPVETDGAVASAKAGLLALPPSVPAVGPNGGRRFVPFYAGSACCGFLPLIYRPPMFPV